MKYQNLINHDDSEWRVCRSAADRSVVVSQTSEVERESSSVFYFSRINKHLAWLSAPGNTAVMKTMFSVLAGESQAGSVGGVVLA